MAWERQKVSTGVLHTPLIQGFDVHMPSYKQIQKPLHYCENETLKGLPSLLWNAMSCNGTNRAENGEYRTLLKMRTVE